MKLLLYIGIPLLILVESCAYYTKSNGSVYKTNSTNFSKTELVQADYKTFKVFPFIELAKDKNYVYCEGRPIQADAPTFQSINKWYYKDKTQVYFFGFGNGKEFNIARADPNTFKTYSKYPWSHDAKNIFWGTHALSIIQILTFKPIDENWAKDEEHYYNTYFVVDSADYTSFTILNPCYSRDKQHVFYQNKIIPNCSPNDFVAHKFLNTGHDNEYVYYLDKRVRKITDSDRKAYRIR
jgi:hypothetical protein